MIELPIEKFTQVIPLIDTDAPNYPVVMAVIEGNNPGRIWIDQFENPSVCLVITNAGYSYIGRKGIVKEFLILEVIEILKQHKPIKLIWEPLDLLSDLFKKAGFSSIERIQFYNPALMNGDTTLIDDICKQLPADCEVKLMDATWLKKSNWLSYIKLFYGNEENFLKNGYALALIKNNELASEGIACYIGGNYAEIGYVTSENHRGKGYATIVSAFLIRESLSRKLQPVSSCNLDNTASAKASQKLGFEIKRMYQFLLI